MGRRDAGWLILLGALWGAAYPLTTVVLRDLPASATIVGRTALSAVVLIPLAQHQGVLHAARARPLALLGAVALQATTPLVLLTAGQQHVGAGLAGILLASQAVWAAIISAAIDRTIPRNVASGVLVGLAGVVLLFLRDLDLSESSGAGGVALVGSALCFAAGAVYIERVLPEVPPLATATAAMTVSALVLAPFAVVAAPSMPDLGTVGRLLVLAVAATGGALVLFYRLIQRVGAVRANLGGYLAPGFAIVYGATLLDERISTEAIVGLALILSGSYLAGRLGAREVEPTDLAAEQGRRAISQGQGQG